MVILPARADMNDVLAALARQAGWSVDPDGTTYRSSPAPPPPLHIPPSPMIPYPVRSIENPVSTTALMNPSTKAPLDCKTPVHRIEGNSSVVTCYGVVVQCWWSILEGWNPRKYTWSGYRDLFDIIRQFMMKIQVVMAFHESEVNESGDIPVSLPKWVLDLGRDNQDIFFTDREGRRNTECLSWGIDKERALKGRTGIECYDKYLQQSLRKAAKVRGHLFWARGPDNAGQYTSRPHETGFFCDRGDYDNYYGRFFLQWYAQTLVDLVDLVDHADNVLSLASPAFEGTELIVKIPSVYWWYKTSSHAAELAAGFYNPANHDGYSPLCNILKKHSVTMKYVCPRMLYSGEGNDEAFADPDGLSWQVLNSAWGSGLPIAGQNTLSCYVKEGYLKILETAKPRNDPDSHHLSFFVYQQPFSFVAERIWVLRTGLFYKMHAW
ncbi:hypothetical protein MKX01_011578 [Papaver californicum]|nr:hypothetical protein MKX01_011578 [Papaver californicum]